MWKYAQASGELRDGDNRLVETGYSGKGDAKNDPGRQSEKDRGPIPRGLYRLGNARDHPRLGPLAIPLVPGASNEMFGRDAFYVHGDSRRAPGTASTGCIIVSRATRERLAAGTDRRLRVVRAFRAPAPRAPKPA